MFVCKIIVAVIIANIPIIWFLQISRQKTQFTGQKKWVGRSRSCQSWLHSTEHSLPGMFCVKLVISRRAFGVGKLQAVGHALVEVVFWRVYDPCFARGYLFISGMTLWSFWLLCCAVHVSAVAMLLVQFRVWGEQVAAMVFLVNVLFLQKILALRSGQQMWSVDQYWWWEGELQYTLLMEKNPRSSSVIYAFGDVKWSRLKRLAQQALSRLLLPPYFVQIFPKRLFLASVAGWTEVARGHGPLKYIWRHKALSMGAGSEQCLL